ncbi:hypothetical protein [Marinoscillum sp.]|uniref:hypothetical protein n=1 Tax=Marinoscillum sp. TaxID=2024838 RepID=UPI003BAAD9B8
MNRRLTIASALFMAVVFHLHAQWDHTTNTNYITTQNKVGIGLNISSPKSLLSIGTATSNMLSSNGITLGNSDKSIELLHSPSSNGYGSRIYGVDEGSGLTSFRIAVRGNSSSWIDALYIKAATGSVGGTGNIGVYMNNPKERLDVNGSIRIKGRNLDGKDLTYLSNSGAMIIGWNRSQGHGETNLISNRGAGSVGGFEFRDIDNNQGEQVLMKLRGDGTVGIGTNNPSEKLEVNGTIRSKEIKVEAAPWPDYVFAEDYELMSLTQTRDFISRNHHLPEVPSAEEVEANGIAVGEMNALLLKKIEELTLHLLEKDAQIQNLIKRVEKLESNEE